VFRTCVDQVARLARDHGRCVGRRGQQGGLSVQRAALISSRLSGLRFLAALVVIASFFGCAERSSTQSPPSSVAGSPSLTADQLSGTWTLVSIQPTGQADQATPQGASYTLTFADGRLWTRVDCNVCNGAFTLSGQTLTAGPAFACTRAACPTMAFESGYTSLLSGQSTVLLSNNVLALSSARGVLRFNRQQ
jgi:heat shock protein HslJ